MRKYVGWLGFLLVIVVLVVVGFWSAGLLRGLAQGVSGLGEKLSTQVGRLIYPTPTIIPDPVTVVREVRSLARLETIHYTVEKVITGETRQGTFAFLFGDRMLFVAHGVVVAGVDLGKMEQQDVWDDGMGTLYVNLPEAEIFISTRCLLTCVSRGAGHAGTSHWTGMRPAPSGSVRSRATPRLTPSCGCCASLPRAGPTPGRAP